jgi:PAS domain S-box-containing protein
MKKKIVDAIVATRDAGPHRRAAEATEDDLYKTLANNLQLGVYIAVDKRLRFTNFHLQEYTGYSRSEMIDMDPLDLVHPDDREKAVVDASNMLRGLRFSPYEYRLISKDGHVKWILETVVPIMFKGNKAILGNSIDITEYKTAKMDLQEFDALKASILDAIPQGVVGLENRRINFANTAVEEVFGWKPEELIGKSVTLFYRNEQEAEAIGRQFYNTLEHQRTFVSEYNCRRKDGRDILCRMRSARIGDALKQRRIVITYEDITEQRKAQEELANSRERLRNLSVHLQSVREKESTRIAREIHDELGQYLTALQMDLAWLGVSIPQADLTLAAKIKRMKSVIDTTIENVHRISTELRPILLDDLGLIAAMEWQAGEFRDRTNIQCDARFDLKESAVEKELATAIFRIFQEMLTNIVRHARATHVRVRLMQKGNELRLDVSDNGIGITEEDINNSASFGIVGIRERANLWGGTVHISGKPHKGTKVSVRIPIQSGRRS